MVAILLAPDTISHFNLILLRDIHYGNVPSYRILPGFALIRFCLVVGRFLGHMRCGSYLGRRAMGWTDSCGAAPPKPSSANITRLWLWEYCWGQDRWQIPAAAARGERIAALHAPSLNGGRDSKTYPGYQLTILGLHLCVTHIHILPLIIEPVNEYQHMMVCRLNYCKPDGS
jgi:hypothetical protein